ncbi:MAG: hypothetical protein FJX78_01130 [Armatimonadetes bacterium]|nr:hypothetical protein [Armatimonadota bacterium]
MLQTRQSIPEAIQDFLTVKRISGCTTATLEGYQHWLSRFHEIAEPEPLAVRRFFAGLQEQGLQPSTVHKVYRILQTFFCWWVALRILSSDPLDGLKLRLPKTLPRVPSEEELRALVSSCSRMPTGARNRALILVLADAGTSAIVTSWPAKARSPANACAALPPPRTAIFIFDSNFPD